MIQNVGKTDKIIRLIVAAITLYLGIVISPWFLIITGVMIFTSMIGWCGLYSLLGVNTCKIKKKSK